MTKETPPPQSRTRAHAGLPPGTLIYLGEKRVENVTVAVIDYNENEITERLAATPAECSQYISKKTVTWINVTGLHDTDFLAKLGEVLEIHPLVLEDILHTGQRPKLEDHDNYIFIVFQMFYRQPDTPKIVSEQVSMILGPGYVITFQEMEGDVFEMIRDRIRAGKGRIRKMGCDYLAYALLDAIVDNYFVVLDDLDEHTEDLHEAVLSHPETETLQAIHRLRRELIFVRKRLWPLRELVAALEKSENRLIQKDLRPYLRDVYEHTIQVIDTVESLRDVMSGVMDIYITMVSNRTNDVMKVLTVIATLFIPLTFVAGIYGMNFEFMPELRWPWGYFGALGVMGAIGLNMLIYFKRRGWL